MKITLNDISAQNSVTTAASTVNNNNNTLEVAFENTLSRDGTSPNQMSAPLDMNSNQVLNLPAPENANSPLRYQDLSDFVGGGTVTNIPTGGVTGDILTKTSNTNYDVGWSHVVLSVLPGTNIAVTGASPATVSTIPNPTFSTSVTTPNLVLAGTSLTTKTGTGSVVLNTSPTLITPALGTPSSGVATNLTGTAAGLTAGSVTTNANLTGPITSTGNATAVASQTGTGSTFVMNTSPTLVTPNLGTPSAAVLTNATGTASGLTAGSVTTNANLTGAVTSTGNATLLGSFTSANLRTALTDETGTGAAVFATSPALVTPTGIVKGDVGLGNVDNTSDVTKNAAVKTLTNTTYDTAGTGNSFSINSVAVTANTGTGAVVRATSPTLVTPALGTPSSANLANATAYPFSNLSGIAAGVATFVNNPTSANLAATITDETGTGALVFATSPTLVTPILGTPTSGVATNLTGTAAGLTAGTVTTNANLTGAVTSVGNATSLGSFSSAQLATALTDEDGTGVVPFETTGTWTPTDQSGAALTFTGVNCRYTKIGNIIHAYGQLTFPTTVSAASNLIGGLPFTVPNSTYAVVTGPARNNAATTASLITLTVQNTVNFTFYSNSTGAPATNANLSAGVLNFNIIYPAT